jgi:large repetitive protein
MKKIFILTIAVLFFSNYHYSLLAQSYSSSVISGISEIAGTGTSVTLTASAASSTSSGALPIGFTFNFYGNAYTNFYINPNGTLSFGGANQTYMSPFPDPYSTNMIPSTQTPNNFIGFAYLAPRSGYGRPTTYPNYTTATINYFVSGNAPSRILVVNFKGVTYPGEQYLPAQTFNIQIQMSEGSNGKIEVHNTNNSAQYNTGAGAYEFIQIGLENIDGSIGVAATSNYNWYLDNKTIQFTYCTSTPNIPSNVTPSTSICNAVSSQTVNLVASCALGTVAWYKADGTTPLPSTTVSPTTSTSYKVRCENNGCNSALVSTDITVGTSNPTAPTVTLNPSYPVNAGTSVSLTTNCYNNFVKWDDNTTTSPRIVTPNVTTAYSAKCILNSCESPITNFSVNVIVPPPTLTASINPICSGTSTVLTAGNCTGTLTWNNSLGTGTSKTVSPTTGTNYLVTCSSTALTANLTIGVTTLPTAPTSITKNPTTPVNPNASVILTAVGCVSGNTIKWDDNSTTNPRTVTPATTTTYTAKCVNATCESATATSVTVDVLPTITVSNTTPTNICSNAGTSFPVTFTTTGAFTGSFVVTLTKTISGFCQGQTFVLTTATTATSPTTLILSSSEILTPSGNGGGSCNNVSYKIDITSTSTLGAISSNSYTITVNPRPIISTSFTGSCGSQTANFTTQTMPSGTFQWKKDGVNVGSPNTGTSSTYVATVAGSYTVDYTDAICTVTSNAVVFNQNAVPTIALIPPVSPNCYSSLTATGCLGTVNWERDYGTSWSVYTTANPFAFPVSTNPTDYRATCTLNGCTSSPSNVLQATPNNFTEIIPSPSVTICSNASTLLNASSTFSGLTYQWRLNNSNISGANASSYTATSAGNYSLYVTSGSCGFATLATTVFVTTAPTLSITSTVTSPATITNGQSLTLNANGCSGGTVLWSNSATTTSITVTPSSNTTYTFTCTNPPCTVVSSGFVINVNALLPPTLSSSAVSTCTGSSVTLTATACAGGGTVTWSTSQTGLTISVSPIITTSYTATCTLGSVTSVNSSPISIAVFDGVITSLASGNWNTPATWSCNCIPAACNDVIVDTGHVVTIPVTQKGRLQNLTLRGTVDVKTTGTMALK